MPKQLKFAEEEPIVSLTPSASPSVRAVVTSPSIRNTVHRLSPMTG